MSVSAPAAESGAETAETDASEVADEEATPGAPAADGPLADDPPAADPPADVPFQTGVEVTTAHGTVRGVSEGGLRVFRGIPYAAPPVGDDRFRAPQPPVGWDGVRDADEYGDSCPATFALNAQVVQIAF